MGKMTKLTAVNTMLLSAGENLVADLTTQSGTDTEIALFLLDRTIEDYQLRGFATTIYQKKVKPDANLKLLLPLDVIAVELVSSHYTSTDNIRIRARMMDGSLLTCTMLLNRLICGFQVQNIHWNTQKYLLLKT